MSTSLAWQLGEWELHEDFEKIEQQWTSLDSISRDSPLFDRRAPDVSGWSCGQHAGPSVTVAQTIRADELP